MMNIRVVGAIACLCMIWGSLWGIVKHSLHIFPPFLFVSVRLILAGFTLMIVQAILKKSIYPQRKEWLNLIILSTLVCFGFYATQTFAMQFVDSGLSAVLVFTMPIFIAVLAHFILKEHLNRQKVLGLICGSVGLIAILWPQLQHLAFNMSLLGQSLLIVSGLFWAIATIYIKKYFLTYDKIKLTIWQFLIGGTVMLSVASVFEPIEWSVWLNPSHDYALFYIAVIGTGFAFVLWNWIVSQVDTFVASISIMCIPILSLFFGAVVWHEMLTKNIMIGAICILMGIMMSSLKTKSKNRVLERIS